MLEYLTGAINGAVEIQHGVINTTSAWPISEKLVVGSMATFLLAYSICKLARYETGSERCVRESDEWLYSLLQER